MGGNVFKNLDVRKIKREDIFETIARFIDNISYPDLTYDYVVQNLMGSTGKKEVSGDIDVALNNHKAKFVGEEDWPVFNLSSLKDRCIEVFGNQYVNVKSMKNGFLHVAYPILGNKENGFAQFDFVSGKNDWIKFTHQSSTDSVWKGAAQIILWNTLTTLHRDYEKYSDGTELLGMETRSLIKEKTAQGIARTARVGLSLSYEFGLHRKWQLAVGNRSIGSISPDEFETLMPDVPRYGRTGYIDCPDEFIRIMLGNGVSREDVNSFEKMVKVIKEVYSHRIEEVIDKFADLYVSEKVSNLSVNDIKKCEVWY